MQPLYQHDLAYIHATASSDLARGAAPEIVRLLKSASIPIRKVLDVGCGSGPLTSALADAGFDVTGIDPSTELLAIARASVPKARFINASVYETAIPACEAVLAVGESLTYHENSDGDRLVENFFRRVADVLPIGGILIFDVIELGSSSSESLTRKFWSSGEDWAVLVETTEDRESRTLVRNIDTFRRTGELYRRSREVHRVRMFDSRVLCDQLAAVGFATSMLQSYGERQLPPRRRAFFSTRAMPSRGDNPPKK